MNKDLFATETENKVCCPSIIFKSFFCTSRQACERMFCDFFVFHHRLVKESRDFFLLHNRLVKECFVIFLYFTTGL
jgi:hypothetical protein